MVIRRKKDKNKCDYCDFRSEDKEILHRHEVIIHGYHRNAKFRKGMYKKKPPLPKRDTLFAKGTMLSKDGQPINIEYIWNQSIEDYDIYALLLDTKLPVIYDEDRLCYVIPNWSGAKNKWLYGKDDSKGTDLSETP